MGPPPLLAGLALGLCLFGGLPACGSASRAVLARQEFVKVFRDPEALSALRGAEAALPFVWMESARVAAVESPEEALALVEAGLTYHPADAALLTARIELLGGLGRYAECMDSARQALSRLPQPGPRAGYRMGLIRALLALQRPAEAESEMIALGGEWGIAPGMVADGWARVALTYANLGRADDAERCFDASLQQGPDGLGALAQETLLHPELLAAARSLRRRAAVGHPADPDLGLTLVIDTMEQGDFVAAARALEALPQPLPRRLEADVHALGARLMILQGQVEAGLASLFERLDAYPLDPPALGVLQETWAKLGQPSDQEMLRRMLIARNSIDARDSRTLARIDAFLDELERRLRSAAESADVDEANDGGMAGDAR